MPLALGSKLGPYEILAPLGAGGMGEVYRARDPRMGREVAIKISAERFSDRFSREVHAVAALNHPNICHLYDVGPDYLVLELVEGPTLAERIQHGALPLEEALKIARQIADALEAAHDKGIVHRDLKPANIKIRPDGAVKVLDFGLAKMAEPAEPGARTENSPTLTLDAATRMGVILGTAAYMSPEQARGKIVDKRADIWAFGVVLCEMVTGKRLFQGEDLTDTLASVVKIEPDVSKAPPQLRRLLKKCLEKDPKKRLRDIGDVWELLEADQAGVAAAPGRSGFARFLPWSVAAVLAIAALALGFVHFREVPPVSQSVRFSMDPPPDSSFAEPYAGYAPSPDGHYVVFGARAGAGTLSLWLRPLDSLTARLLPGTEGGNEPTWSPDSRSLAFSAGGKLKRIEIAGGAPLTLGDATASPVSPTGTWNRAGVILFGGAAGLQRVSASGGGTTLLTKADPAKKETGHGYPQFLPDGNRFLFFVESGDPNVQGVYASSLDHPGQRQQILRTASKAVYVPSHAAYPDYLLWLQNQTLLAQRFDVNSLRLEGDPVSVAEDIGLSPNRSVRASFWASDAGLLIYFSDVSLLKVPVVWIGRDGKQLGDAAPEDTFNDIALAPGAQRMATDLLQGGSSANDEPDIWVRDFARGVMTRLTFDPATDELPVWSPDGKQIAFSSNREGGVFQIFRKDASGAGQEERLSEGPNSKLILDWSKDGKYLLYRELNSGHFDLMVLPLEGDRKPIPVVKTQFSEETGAISPDGRWVAYESNESGRGEIYIQAFPGAGGPKGQWQVSNGGAEDVKWRGDGKELYYESLDGKVMAAAIQAGSQDVRIETPRVLFSADFRIGHTREFEVTPDGQRFLMILNSRTEKAAKRLTVVSNWQAALRK